MNSSTDPAIFCRDGVNASCVVTPDGSWLSLLAFMQDRFKRVAPSVWLDRFMNGDVLNSAGAALPPDAPYHPHQKIYYFRAVKCERPIPFQAQILYQDSHIVIADKPHFLPVVPSGDYLQETLLVRLKRQLQLPHLAPAHRIDRDTAGLVMFTINPAERNAYQALFRNRLVNKVYEAIAPFSANMAFPQERQSCLCTDTHFMRMFESEGAVNAITRIDLLQHDGTWALYQLRPHTGQRHQLRVHMNALGLPLLNDQIYPVLTPAVADDDHAWDLRYTKPLGLLAKSLDFMDPITGAHRHFASQRTLSLPAIYT